MWVVDTKWTLMRYLEKKNVLTALIRAQMLERPQSVEYYTKERMQIEMHRKPVKMSKYRCATVSDSEWECLKQRRRLPSMPITRLMAAHELAVACWSPYTAPPANGPDHTYLILCYFCGKYILCNSYLQHKNQIRQNIARFPKNQAGHSLLP